MFNVIFAHDPAFNLLKRVVSLNKTIRRGSYFLFFFLTYSYKTTKLNIT